jgi:4-hydroxy-L-threonine phosphate dehydrogenase PdxA
MKVIDFGGKANTLLGIPIFPTPVSRDTTYEIAGKNKAASANLKAAVRRAARMATNRLRDNRMPGKRS